MAAPRSQTQSSTGHKCESSVSCNSRSEVLPTGNLLSCGLGQYHSDSMTSVKEKIVSKLNFTNPLLVLPSFVSSKQFKKIVERIYVSTSVLELYAKSVLTDILKVTEKEFQQEDVTSVPGSDASAGIICSLIEGLHSENKDSFYSNEEIKPLDLFNLPRCHSYLGSLSSAAAKMQKAAELHPTHQNMDDQRDFPLDTDPVRFCVIHAEHNNDNMQVPTKNIVKSNRGGDSQVITINGKSNIYARKAKATMQMPSEAGTHIKPGYASNALNRSAVKKSTPEQILVFPQKNNVQIDSENRSVVGFNHIKMSKGDLTITSDNISQPLPSPFGDSKVTEAIDKNLGLQVQGKRAEYDTSVNTFMDNFDNNLGKATNTLVSFAHHSPLAVISDGILNVTKERPSELVTSKGPDPSTECLPEENHLSGLPMIVTRKNEVINTLNSGSQNNSKHAAELKLATEQCCMSNGGTKPVLHFRDSNPSQSTNTILATEVPSLTKNKSAISYSPRSDIDVLNESIANDLIKGTFQTISESAEQSQDDAVYSIRSNQLPHSSNSSSSELTHEEVEGRPCNAFRNKLGKSTPSRNLSNKVSEKITTKPLETCLSTINVESNNSSCGDEGWQTSSTDTRSCKPEEVLDKNKRVKEMQIYHNSNAKQTTLQGNKSITSESSFTSSDFNFTADSMTNIKCGQNMNDLCLEEITESLINSLNDIFQNFQETKCAPHAHARDSDSALPEQSATHIAEAPNSPSLRNTEGTLKPTLLVDMPKATQIALQEKDNHAETENSNQFKQKNIYCSCFPLQRMGDGAGKDIVKQDQMESNVFPETFVKLAVVEVKNKIFNNDTDKRNIFQENFEFYNSFLGSICEDAVKLVFHEISNHMNNGKSKTCTNQKTEEHLLKGDFHSCTSEALSINMNHICHGALLMTISEKNIHDIRLSVMNFLSEKTIDTLKEQQNNLDIKWLAGEIVGIATETLTGFYEDVSLPSKLPQCFKKAGISKSCQNRSTNLCVGPLTVVKKCHSEEHNILSVIKENKEFKQLEDLSISKHIVKHVNCSPLLTLKTNSPVPPPMAEDVSGAYDNSRGTSTEDSTRDPDCDDESSGSSVYQSQTIFLEDERFTGTKLGDIVIQLANTIFPSTTSSSPNTDGEVMHMERNALSLANLLLKELKEEFWNSIDTKFEQFVYSRTDVEKVVQSVYNKYSKELEFPDALQNELKKDNALIVHNLANAIILELVYKRPGSVVSLDPCCLEEYSVFEEFCDEEVARASLCGNESGYKVYSVSLLENIICKVLCRILTTSDVLAYDINNNQKEDNYCEIMVKLMCSVQMYLKTQRVLIVKVNEKMALPTIGDSVIQNVAISVYHRVFEEYGSHMDIYVNLTEGNQLFAELFTYFILQEMSKLDLECDVFEGVEKIPQATIDTSFVTQTILNNISEVKKHNETSIKCFLATLLNILIPQIASQIWLQFQSNGIHSEGQNSILEEDVSVRQRQMVKHKLLAAHQHRRSSSDP
ncbi:hypothetical protein NDU88_007769 [Pleurodeles waltl]|uniref:Fibrous sheath-interacting protein 2 C-terminal domain-containing protein n=1 Tax=Pleurodeles waltl TaxID=8319 RepID=A0AAV7VQM6_PLEWA|nr:hypothetical protein NDU88_007769 [Pleurodeles waltl]